MRVVAIMMIIAHHYFQMVFVTIGSSANSFLSNLFLNCIGFGGKYAINTFVLVSAYFMCLKSLSMSRVLKLYFEILFYAVVGFAFLCLIGKEEPSIRNIFTIITQPFYSIEKGFVGSFMVYYLLISFLNKGIYKLTSQHHLRLLIVLLFIYTVTPTLFLTDFRLPYVMWLIILYLIASYIRIYPSSWMNNAKISASIFFGSILCIWIWMLICGILNIGLTNHLSMDCNKPLALTCGIGMFLRFKNIEVKQSKIINTLAESSFGVLLIHDNSNAMKYFLWQDIYDVGSYYGSFQLVLSCLLFVITTYFACVLIDWIRIQILEPAFQYLQNRFRLNERYIFE